MRIKSLVLVLLACSFIACKKGAGEGGSSSIKGKVFRYKYNADFSAVLDSGYNDKEDVFIIYGDEATYGDDQKTNYDGTYEFKYLRKGKYKIFAYESDSSKYPLGGNKPVFLEIEITQNRKTYEMPDFTLVKQ